MCFLSRHNLPSPVVSGLRVYSRLAIDKMRRLSVFASVAAAAALISASADERRVADPETPSCPINSPTVRPSRRDSIIDGGHTPEVQRAPPVPSTRRAGQLAVNRCSICHQLGRTAGQIARRSRSARLCMTNTVNHPSRQSAPRRNLYNARHL